MENKMIERIFLALWVVIVIAVLSTKWHGGTPVLFLVLAVPVTLYLLYICIYSE